MIATGFPEDGGAGGNSTITHRAPTASRDSSDKDNDSDSQASRGKIFNSLPNRKTEQEKPTPTAVTTEPSIPKRDPKPVDAADEGDEDDWGAVPAFLRRSKLK